MGGIFPRQTPFPSHMIMIYSWQWLSSPFWVLSTVYPILRLCLIDSPGMNEFPVKFNHLHYWVEHHHAGANEMLLECSLFSVAVFTLRLNILAVMTHKCKILEQCSIQNPFLSSLRGVVSFVPWFERRNRMTNYLWHKAVDNSSISEPL